VYLANGQWLLIVSHNALPASFTVSFLQLPLTGTGVTGSLLMSQCRLRLQSGAESACGAVNHISERAVVRFAAAWTTMRTS
jgi:hypothetical protein